LTLKNNKKQVVEFLKSKNASEYWNK